MDVFSAGKINPETTLDYLPDEHDNDKTDAETSQYTDVWTKFLIAIDKEKGDMPDKCVKVILTWGGNVEKDENYMHFIAFIRVCCGGKREVLETLMGRMCGMTYQRISEKYGKCYRVHCNRINAIMDKHPNLEPILKSVFKFSDIVRNE